MAFGVAVLMVNLCEWERVMGMEVWRSNCGLMEVECFGCIVELIMFYILLLMHSG